MGSYPDEFPFGIMEVVELLHLRRQTASMWTVRSAATAAGG